MFFDCRTCQPGSDIKCDFAVLCVRVGSSLLQSEKWGGHGPLPPPASVAPVFSKMRVGVATANLKSYRLCEVSSVHFLPIRYTCILMGNDSQRCAVKCGSSI